MADIPIKYPYVGGTKWKFMSWADIPDAKNKFAVYLRRLRVIQTPWFAIYVHWIFKKDDDRDPHDHPFNFWSLVLRGGYTESVFIIREKVRKFGRPKVQSWGRWSFHKMSRNRAHMITALKPGTVTLVFCGPKKRYIDSKAEWGFYPNLGFVPWSQYNREKFDHSGDALA